MSEFLPAFQNVDTYIFKIASIFQKRFFKNFSWGLRDLKMTKNYIFGKKYQNFYS